MRFSFITRFSCLVFILSFASLIVSCGGDGDQAQGESNAPEARISALSLDGFTIDFSPEITGPYEVTVDSSVNSVAFTASADAEATLSYTYVSGGGVVVVNESFTSDQPVTVDIQTGVNSLLINVSSSASTAIVSYNLSIVKTSNEASIEGLIIRDLDLVGAGITLTPIFSPDVFSYTGTLDAGSCATQVQLLANSVRTDITVNDNSVISGSGLVLPSVVGTNNVAIVAQSEEGDVVVNYDVVLERPSQTQAQLDASNRLTGLSVSGAEFGFHCAQVQTLVDLNVSNTSPTLTITPESTGATLTLSDVVDGELTNERTVDAATPINLTLSEGLNEFVISVDPVDESIANREYAIALNVLSSNVVLVNTPEELQAALTNAQPADQIRLSDAVFNGLAPDALGGSGFAGAHFYSAASGTQEDPIALIGPSSGSAELVGASATDLAVLQIAGDHWVIANMMIRGAKTGLILDGASDNSVINVEFSNLGEQGLVLQNGSHNNFINESRFSDIGSALSGADIANADAIVIGSDSNQWNAAAGGSGDLEPLNNNNQLRENTFSQNLIAQSIEVNEGAQDTLIEFNRFATGSLSDVVDAGSLIRVQGNDTVIRFNQFMHNGDVNAQALITVAPASVPTLPDNWGMDTQVYKNSLSLNEQSLAVVSASDASRVVAADNLRVDALPAEYIGALVNSTTFTSPSFQVQWVEDPTQCMALGESNGNTIAILDDCSDAADQRWQFVLDEQGFVQITNQSVADMFLRPAIGFTVNSVGVLLITTPSNGFLQRWLPEFVEGSITFSNKQNDLFDLAVVEADSDDQDSLVVVGVNAPFINRQFRLITVQ